MVSSLDTKLLSITALRPAFDFRVSGCGFTLLFHYVERFQGKYSLRGYQCFHEHVGLLTASTVDMST